MSKAMRLDLPLIFGTVGTPLSAPKAGGSTGGVARIRELNLGALELAWVRGTTNIGDEVCARIRAAAEIYQVALSVHASYFFNLNATSDEMWQAGRERLLQAARLGYKAGATDIIFHPGSYMKQEPKAVFGVARDRLAGIADQLIKEKIGVILRPETMGKSALLGTLEECIAFSQTIENVLPCVDFAHLHARPGDGTFNSYKDFSSALKLIADGLGPRGLNHMHVHFSGIAYGPKGEKNHLVLEESDIKYKEFFKALADCGARGRVMSETPNMEEGAIVMQNTYARALRARASAKPN